MAKKAAKEKQQNPVIATNRKARHNYDVEDSLEAGIVLTGSEIKSLREGRASLADAYARFKGREIFVEGIHIPPYERASYQNHEPLRSRKLLLHREQILRLKAKSEQQGSTLIPLKLYLKGGRVKVELGVAKGRKLHDKRRALAEKDAKRWMQRSTGTRRG